MDREKVNDSVKQLFLNFFHKEESKPQNSYCTDNFFSSKMGLLPGDVLAYLFAVEKEFDIQVPSSYILEGKFNTLNNVTDIVCEVLPKKL